MSAILERYSTATAPRFFITGGTLPKDARCYVRRKADTLLYDYLLKGEFCYLLTSRQMGKSSLMVRTANRLRESADRAVVILDLTALGVNVTAVQWYLGQIRRVGRQLDIENALLDFWYAHSDDGPYQRFATTLSEAQRLSGKPLVCFIDEIDITRSLPFSTDEFFAGIRASYNAGRSEESESRTIARTADITFCLLGVASPSELIQDPRNTPFNIGHRITLDDFTYEEMQTLQTGLAYAFGSGTNTAALLQRIYHWTAGHPYLTQRVCQELVCDSAELAGNIGSKNGGADTVDRLCERLFFLQTAQETDDNLLFVCDRLLRAHSDVAAVLTAYKRVLAGQEVAAADDGPVRAALQLSGVTRRSPNGALTVRNRIYQKVFDAKWADASMPDAEQQRQKRAFRQGVLRTIAVTGSLSAVLFALTLTAFWANQRANVAEEEARHRLLIADLNLAQQAYHERDLGRMEQILQAHQTNPAETSRVEYRLLRRLLVGAAATIPHFPLQTRAVTVTPAGGFVAVGNSGLACIDKDGKADGIYPTRLSR